MALLIDTLRLFLPPLLAAAVALRVDRALAREGPPPPMRSAAAGAALRRASAAALLALVLLLSSLGGLATLGAEPPPFEPVPLWQLFLVQGLVATGLLLWGLLLFWQPRTAWRSMARRWAEAVGWNGRQPGRELLLGVALGAAGWALVLIILSGVGALTAEWLPQLAPGEVPPLVGWMAGLPLVVRMLVALSAGLVEETFFRGLLQPRVGIAVSTGLFVLAHLNYGEPLLLVGVLLLSVGFALVTRWRGNVWAAVSAHATFDAIQLLFLIPAVVRTLEAT